MTPRPPSSTLFPSRRSSDLRLVLHVARAIGLEAATREPASAEEVMGRLGLGDRRALVPIEWILRRDRKSTRLNSSHVEISYAVFCLKKKKARTASSARKPSM